MNLEEIRDRKEREAKEYAEAMKRWLQIAGIATAAVMRAAAKGDEICREAARKIWPLLPEPRAEEQPSEVGHA